MGHLSSSALCSTHRLSRLHLAALHHCCCLWWPSHGTRISQMLGLLLQLGCITSNILSWALHHESLIKSSPELSSETATLPHSVRPQLLSMTPSHLPNQHHLSPLTLPRSAASTRHKLGHIWNQLLCADSQETLSRRCHLRDAGLCSITVNFSAPADQHRVSQQSKGFTSVVLQPQLTRTTESNSK